MSSIAVVSAGAMGSAVAAKLVNAGKQVLTTLAGRSDATRERARKAGMEDVPLSTLIARSTIILSILPPSDAVAFAEYIVVCSDPNSSLTFVDCNAVNPETIKRISQLFVNTAIRFVDAAIIGGPPNDHYDPTFYASGDDWVALDAFIALENSGLHISALEGGIGQASALKMSYAGITKGTTGLFTAMILAAHDASPATAEALLHELSLSQPQFLERITKVVPPMIPKAYRWVGEMEEIGEFVGGEQGRIYQGLAQLYGRVDMSLNSDGEDVETLKTFVKDAKQKLDI